MRRAMLVGLLLLACGPVGPNSAAVPPPVMQAQPAQPLPDGTRLVVTEPSPMMWNLYNGPRRISPENPPRNGSFTGSVLVPGTEVEVDFSESGIRPEFERAQAESGPMPWLHIRIISSPAPVHAFRRGWVHQDTLAQNTTPRDAPAASASVLRPSLLCTREPVRSSASCLDFVPAATSVQVLDCSPRRAHVRYYRADGRFAHGYVMRSQLSEGACQGVPPPRDPASARSAEPGAPQRPPAPVAEEDQALPSTPMEIYSSRAYLCDTAEAARTGRSCPGGHVLARGEPVKVFGDLPTDGAWRCEVGKGADAQQGYIAAEAVNDYPNIEALDENSRQLASVPDAQRLVPSSLRIEQLLNSPDKERLQGKVLQTRLQRNDIYAVLITDDEYSFLVDLSGAPLRFTFRSEEFTKLVRTGSKSYRCTAQFCDPLMFNARFTGRIYESVDERGRPKRYPLFEVEGLADRFGFYPADGLVRAPGSGKSSKSRSRGR